MTRLGIIGGSGLYTLSASAEGEVLSIPETPYGTTSGPLVSYQIAGCDVIFLARHGPAHHLAPHEVNYRANLWAMHEVGVKKILAINAVGGIGAGYDTGVIVIPDQLIDYSYGRHQSFHQADTPVDHVDFTDPYSERLRSLLLKASVECNQPVLSSGVYGCTQGPRLETAAEIRRLARDGCDLVGMTGMPEAGLARELSIDYACIALVVNRGAGLSDETIEMADIVQALESGMQCVEELLMTFIQSYCGVSLES